MMPFFSKLGFTRNETKVTLLIIFVLIAGAGIKYSGYLFAGDNSKYDYSKTDEEFKRLTEEARKKEFDALSNNSLVNTDSLSKELAAEQDSIEAIEKEPKVSKKELKLREKSINLNTAEIDQLVSLPGIGEGTAEKILEYRKRKGKFKSIAEIKNVKGIGEKKFEKIKEYLTIE